MVPIRNGEPLGPALLEAVSQFLRDLDCCEECISKVDAERDRAAGIEWNEGS